MKPLLFVLALLPVSRIAAADSSKTLQHAWTFQSGEPAPAWTRGPRMQFDWAPQPIAAGGMVVFGSSRDAKVYALDAETGRTRWEFFTEGPVRFAPAVWKDCVLVASDDGFLYSLGARDGSLRWKYRAAPNDELVLGNGRMISRWPVRGGPAVRDGVVYFGAGIWPSEGVFLIALDAETGKPIWRNDQSGDIKMRQPHGAMAQSGVAIQGCLAVTDERIYVPTGRGVPACFDRKTGRFEYFHLDSYGKNGGGPVLALDDGFLCCGKLFDAETGRERDRYATYEDLPALARCPDGALVASPRGVVCYAPAEKSRETRQGRIDYHGLQQRWAADVDLATEAVLYAADEIFLGGPGKVVVLDAKSQAVLQTFDGLRGTVRALAFDNGRLIAATDSGDLSCFTANTSERPAVVHPGRSPATSDETADATARQLVHQSGVTGGYAVVLDNAALAAALLRQSDLYVVAVESGRQEFEGLRQRLDEAGQWGLRAVVFHRPIEATGLPDHFANLVVAKRESPEAARLQRPCGGVLCTWTDDGWKTSVRGPLPGAGRWTHQYADARNSLCSNDSIVCGPLAMLWYRDYPIGLPNRHLRGPSPLYDDGRIFHAGLDGIIAVDAYNGHELWRHEIPELLSLLTGYGVTTTGGVFCLGNGQVFVRKGPNCFCLDAATGQLRRTFSVPDEPDGVWGYLAFCDGRLYGSAVDKSYLMRTQRGDSPHHYPQSKRLFAVDPNSGKVLWQYGAERSIRHNAIVVDRKNVYLIDRPKSEVDLMAARRGGPEIQDEAPPNSSLIALDKVTGESRWRQDEDIFGTTLLASDEHDSLVMTFQYTYLSLPTEQRDRMAVFDSRNGRLRWAAKLGNRRSRPVLIGRRLYRDGEAWDLLTGDKTTFAFNRTYGCGHLTGSPNLLLFRSGTVGYFDLSAPDRGVQNYGGIRSGCFVNLIPAGGLVLAPDSTEQCSCGYLNKTWFALQPKGIPSAKPHDEPLK